MTLSVSASSMHILFNLSYPGMNALQWRKDKEINWKQVLTNSDLLFPGEDCIRQCVRDIQLNIRIRFVQNWAHNVCIRTCIPV